MAFLIRELNENDYDKGYLEILRQLSKIDLDIITKEIFLEFLKKLTSNHKIYVIEKNGKIIGSGTLLIEHKLIHNVSNVGHIEDIIVDSEHRGTRIGKTLITFLIGQAEYNRCYKVILDCKKENIGFYEKIGFSNKEYHMARYF